jgi:hypothetical protein
MGSGIRGGSRRVKVRGRGVVSERRGVMGVRIADRGGEGGEDDLKGGGGEEEECGYEEGFYSLMWIGNTSQFGTFLGVPDGEYLLQMETK